jgi:hypothetical protein
VGAGRNGAGVGSLAPKFMRLDVLRSGRCFNGEWFPRPPPVAMPVVVDRFGRLGVELSAPAALALAGRASALVRGAPAKLEVALEKSESLSRTRGATAPRVEFACGVT